LLGRGIDQSCPGTWAAYWDVMVGRAGGESTRRKKRGAEHNQGKSWHLGHTKL
jgi:hypothetical protein